MKTCKRSVLLYLLPLLALLLLSLAGCKSETAVEPAPLFPEGTKATKYNDPHADAPVPEQKLSQAEIDKQLESHTAPPADAPKPAAGRIVSSGTGGPTKADVDAARKAGTQHIVIETVKGTMEAELYGDKAPITVANFVKLIKKKFYDGLTFHRVESDPAFTLIQGGDPNGDGTGGPGYSIVLEEGATALHHKKGALAMARAGDPDSAGCQFYICRGEISQLDGQYAVFGQITKGLDVADKIQKGDKIKKITLK